MVYSPGQKDRWHISGLGRGYLVLTQKDATRRIRKKWAEVCLRVRRWSLVWRRWQIRLNSWGNNLRKDLWKAQRNSRVRTFITKPRYAQKYLNRTYTVPSTRSRILQLALWKRFCFSWIHLLRTGHPGPSVLMVIFYGASALVDIVFSQQKHGWTCCVRITMTKRRKCQAFFVTSSQYVAVLLLFVFWSQCQSTCQEKLWTQRSQEGINLNTNNVLWPGEGLCGKSSWSVFTFLMLMMFARSLSLETTRIVNSMPS